MPQKFSINIEDVVDLIGLERDPKSKRGASSFFVKCPFCNDKKYHMNINTERNAYRCVLCSGDRKNTGTLDLYGRAVLGIPLRKDNGKELYIKLMEDLRRDSVRTGRKIILNERTENKEIERASDAAVNKAYAAVMEFPHFALSGKHKENLIARGLDEESIKKNGYFSMPSDSAWISGYPHFVEAYTRYHLGAVKEKYDGIKYCKADALIAGMIVANECIKQKCQLQGVPGFFKLGNIWCFRCEAGMGIPTRNSKGEVVGLQVRKDTKPKHGLRYITISSKGLPEGVTTGISSLHFPLNNCEFTPGTRVVFTEGPLKADVALHLMQESENVAFIALPGVNNTLTLPSILASLKKKGVSVIYNGFDMDKTTNIHVAAAGRTIDKIAKKAGLLVHTLFWDEPYATQLAGKMGAICLKNGYAYRDKNIFIQIQHMAQFLENRKITWDSCNQNGLWDPKTKGIDDYLLSLRDRASG